MEGVIPKRSSSDAAAAAKAEPSLLSSLPPPATAPIPPQQQKKVQQPSQSQQLRPPSARTTETTPLPQVSSMTNYQPRPKTAVLSDREKRMVKNLDELADIVSSNISDAIESRNIMLNVDLSKQRERQGGSIELFGSFITNAENQFDFFDTDPMTNTIYVTPLPNNRMPIFPEDFPPGSVKAEWPLKWWGIHQPNESLLKLHEEKALSLGYPVRRSSGSRIQSTAEKPSGSESKDSKPSSKTEGESRRKRRSGENSKDRSRKRHADDRRHRRS